MLPRNHPDRIQIAFDDPRLVANAGLILPVTLAGRLGLSQLVDNHVDLGDAPGRANTGDKILTLVASALAGGEHRRRRRVAGGQDLLGTGLCGQGSIHDLPAVSGGDMCELDRVSGSCWRAPGTPGQAPRTRL